MTHPANDQLKDVKLYLAACEVAMQAGEEINLEDLKNKVVELCTSVTTLSADEAREFKPHLEELVGKLDSIAAGLNLQHSQVLEKVKELDVRKKANQAYIPQNLNRDNDQN